ncbi:DNA polymerase III subunit chi [Parasulfitobacter algicola]|uniref:DNA polymerase III subunit chi n=1 Tax=Parasulfitobacter algicola TaxID=2614809 RepID=A0ABX2IX14_9RHOB|nr:DNA polymerase III subunit chi [Sulfitobacter algicola]NSX55720.1 DNA polymerase III subunit chi [Sulfitobacter algicola]
MGAVFFYHLTRQPLEVTLPMLLGKATGAGWRVVIRGQQTDRIEMLDRVLWIRDDGFMPHGVAGGPYDSDQPILLTTADDIPNSARCLMAVDGADVAADEVNKMERVCILFDGNNETDLARARVQWKTLTDAGCAAQYWSEESGRWEKKAESGA